MKLTYLTAIRQRNNEPVTDYIQRFRDIKSRCFSLSLSDSQLAELAFQGLLQLVAKCTPAGCCSLLRR
jgi:hypothetical protein